MPPLELPPSDRRVEWLCGWISLKVECPVLADDRALLAYGLLFAGDEAGLAIQPT
jgi:hypothetical protein